MKIPKKETIAVAALTVLVGMTSGKAGAKIVYALINEHYARSSKLKNKAHSAVSEKTFRVILGRLRNEKLVAKDENGLWGITRQGRNMAASVITFFKKRDAYSVPKNPKEKIVIVFDIPEKRRSERTLFRFELLALEFIQLQKSVWMGNGPLPSDFIAYLRDHDLLRCVHVFSINKKGTISIAV